VPENQYKGKRIGEYKDRSRTKVPKEMLREESSKKKTSLKRGEGGTLG